MLDSCLFAVQLADAAVLPLVERRIRRLVGFYGALHQTGSSSRFIPSLRLLTGAIHFHAAPSDSPDVSWWGGSPPPRLVSATRVLDASDRELRSLEGGLAMIAASGRSARLLTGSGAPTALYEAGSEQLRAWSTHAVAAAWLSRGEARVDPAAVVELTIADFVGGERALIEGVRAIPPATRISLSPDGACQASYWPPGDRWRHVPEEDAQAHAERELLSSLARRLAPFEHVSLGLTGGLDSRAVAVALRDLGLPFDSYTWGDPQWKDVNEAAAVAEAVGVRHNFQPLEWFDDETALEQATVDVRWTEGAVRIGPGRVNLPRHADALVTGSGGETGRAFYYWPARRRHGHPGAEELTRTLASSFQGRLASARQEARELMRARAAEWVAAAERTGHSGWRCLDVLYAEQRLQRWGRSALSRQTAPILFAFATPEVLRGLVSLPLEERVSNGFHRRFLDSRAPELAPPPKSSPAPVDRLASRLSGLAGRIRRRLPGGGATGPRWEERPAFRAWISDGVLGSPLIVGALGQPWTARVREGFERGDPELEAVALTAAAPVALDEALTDLNGAGVG